MAEPEHSKRPADLSRIGIRELRQNLTGFLRQARQGNSFLITSHGQVLAEIRPPSIGDRARREPGSLRGKIQLAPDFDALPPEILAAMEAED